MRNLLLLLDLWLAAQVAQAQTYNPLWIPDTISGTQFNLTLKDTTKAFKSGTKTVIGGINHDFWGPTLIMNQGDSVFMHVKNKMNDSTTIHWHGMHLPAVMDGGPHQIIPPGTTWTPYWKINQQAATLWYHPHLHMEAQKQLTLGVGGMIIVRDAHEKSLALPRTYGVDDIPLALTSRAFDGSNQLVTSVRAYGDYFYVNGTENAQVSLPKQYVRLRVLNADIARGYNVGFSDNRNFYVIATDGGLVNAPIQTNRVILMIGERVEILVDLSGDAVGSSISLKAFNSTVSSGGALSFPGGEPQTSGAFGSLLNAKDFNLLNIKVAAQTANPILSVPAVLNNDTYWTASDAKVSRTISLSGGQPPGGKFTLDNKAFGFSRIDQNVNVNDTEKWSIANGRVFGHAFHIHDIEFRIISRTSGVKNYENGWKDVVYVPNGETVVFVAKFTDYSDIDADHPYMYHCHLANHEDEGMMGQFLVTGTAVSTKPELNTKPYFTVAPNPATNKLRITLADEANTPYYMVIRAANGRALYMSPKPQLADGIDISQLPAGVYTIHIRDTQQRAWSVQRFVKE